MLLVAGAGLLAAPVVYADDASVVEGPGIPVGEGSVFHPTLGADVGFTNNVFYEDQTPRMAGLFRLVAEAALASKKIDDQPIDPMLDAEGEAGTPTSTAAPKTEFRFGGMLRYDEYLSPNAGVRAQRTLGADLDGGLTMAPQGTFAFSADEHFVRDTRPTNFEQAYGNQNNRIANNLALALRYQPGGGMIAGELRWQNQIDFFEQSTTRFADRMINSLGARGDWRLFPYTRFLAEFNYSFVNGLGDNMLGGTEYKRSAQPIRGGLGVQTVLAELVTFKLHVGWAYASYNGGAAYNAPELGAEFGYQYSPTGRIVAEYAWEHRDSINSDFYRDHRVSGHLDQQFGARLLASARADIRWRTYEGISPAIGVASRSDFLAAIGVRASYVLKDTFAIVADYHTAIDQTDFMSIGTGGPGDDPSYIRHEITAGVRAAF
ncbi:MAG: hypothetical protein KC464_06265 [Myxococcales bacterium]|nr:hypothetical protein [Myxococcales bacterium]